MKVFLDSFVALMLRIRYESKLKRESMRYKNLIRVFNNLSQEVRFKVFKLLVKSGDEGLYPSEMLKKIKISAGTLSFHLKELENSGLITKEKHGRNIVYRINSDTLASVTSFLIDECNEYLDE